MSIREVMARHNKAMEPILAAIDKAMQSGDVDPESLMETVEGHVGWWAEQNCLGRGGGLLVEAWSEQIDGPEFIHGAMLVRRSEAEARIGTLRAFIEKMWMELDDAADAIGPVPDLVERNLRAWSREAGELLKRPASDEERPS